MKPAGKLLPVLLAAGAALALGPAAVAAEAAVEGPCQANFNGVEVAQIDSLASPLLLDSGAALVFAGSDPAGTASAHVSVLLGPLTVGREEVASAAAATEFLASLDLAEVAPYGVGLLRVRASTDNCRVEAWLRLGGRLPFTTLVGITGLSLAVAGLAAQVVAWVLARRWSLPVAAGAGVATGAGGALLGQQFGRLQLSYWSLAGAVALAVAVGLAVPLLRRARVARGARRADRQDEESPPVADAAEPPGAAELPASEQPVAQPSAEAAPAVDVGPQPRTEPALAPPQAAGPFWSYVLSHVEVLHLDDYDQVVATLVPGRWYLAKREVSGWVQVVAEEGVEGWVPRGALHPEG